MARGRLGVGIREAKQRHKLRVKNGLGCNRARTMRKVIQSVTDYKKDRLIRGNVRPPYKKN